ncbi:hypothetical protein Aros01_06729 [Streptosporangium roseum]|uniref:Uncharacterized protein n=2 Tax=Streptosporangium roseum TaxID=2001 RepID=D2ASF3_STRRD|nr:hypothetical protein Sros_5728 [Streptosporangium roseum DSM 43021]
MRRMGAMAAVSLALLSGGCASGAGDPEGTPTKAAAPVVPPAVGSAEAVVVSQKGCSEPARAADGFQAASVRPSWKLLSVTGEAGALRGGATASDGALWALRDTGEDLTTPVRWKDGRWEAVAMPPGVKVVKALVTGPGGEIWAVQPGAETWKGGVLGSAGWRGSTLTVPGNVREDGPADAHGGWVSFGAAAVHWDGTSWKRVDLPADQGGEGASVGYRLSGSDEEVWAVPAEGPKAVRLRDGVSQVVEFALRIDAREAIHDTQGGAFYPQAVAVVGADETWVLGAAAFGTHYLEEGEDTEAGRVVALHHARGTWRCTWGPFHRENFEGAFTDAVPDGDGGLWAVTAESTLWHLSGGRWTRERLPADEGAEPHVTDLVAAGHEIYALGSVASGEQSHGALWRAG